VLRSLGEVVSPAVSFTNHAPHQYAAETAGSKAHLERTGSLNIRLPFRFRQSVGTQCGDEACLSPVPIAPQGRRLH